MSYTNPYECRPNCGACCIAPSISSSIPGMEEGKPAGIRCIHLTEDFKCAIFNSPLRPKVCSGFKPEPVICGSSKEDALKIITKLESECNVKTNGRVNGIKS